jgi:transcription initiation factor IIF auxiliary subunit
MSFSVQRQVIKNAKGQIKFWKPSSDGREHYHVGIWIDGPPEDLDAVDYVEYKLHPSFKRPHRTSSNRKNNFSITIWTWGMFKIEIAIYLRDGSVENIPYFLSYELPADEGDNYVAVDA